MDHDYEYVKPGIAAELQSLDLADLQRHLAIYSDNFLMDEFIASHYHNRLSSDPNLGRDQGALRWLRYVVAKLNQYLPFYPAVLSLAQTLENDPERKVRLGAKAHLVTKIATSSGLLDRISGQLSATAPHMARKALQDLLRREPSNMQTAVMLLDLDLEHGFDSAEWLGTVRCPSLLEDDWKSLLLIRAVRSGRADLALPALQGRFRTPHETFLTHLGLFLLRQGDRDTALQVLRTALALDGLQTPVRRLVQELEHPFKVDPQALEGARVVIGIYSYNKAEMLHMTLRNLTQTAIGDARILILLNGCTDNSVEVARQAQEFFPANEVELLELPVNMGAPQARNLLLHKALQREFDYMAYLDDDVTLPPDWLQAFVTEARRWPKAGAVGCKVLDPAPATTLQYVHKGISIAKPSLIRLSLSAPLMRHDTGLYDVSMDTDMVMGCSHLVRRESFDKVPAFDISFAPSQLDDVAFHLDLRLAGYEIRYLGQVACQHHRNSGSAMGNSMRSLGNGMGNDVKFHYRFVERLAEIQELQRARIAGQPAMPSPAEGFPVAV